jgi:hypothetical protein
MLEISTAALGTLLLKIMWSSLASGVAAVIFLVPDPNQELTKIHWALWAIITLISIAIAIAFDVITFIP